MQRQPVEVTEIESWRLELEQLDDGTTAVFPRRGTITMWLRMNRTTQPDPICEGEVPETVTAFLADVKVGAASVATVAVDVTASPGTYDMTVCATIVADPLERCHPAPLALVVPEEDDADTCRDFSLRLDFNPIPVVAGASDVVPVFVDRAPGFAGQVELTLDSVAGGPAPAEALAALAPKRALPHVWLNIRSFNQGATR